MKLTARTKVGKLIEAHPFLIEFLGGWEPKFQMLKNPIARKTVVRFTSLGRAASMVGRDVGELIGAIAAEIEQETGERVQVDTATQVDPEVDPEKVEVLRGIIRKLHEGADVEAVKAEFAAAVDDVSPAEIAAMVRKPGGWRHAGRGSQTFMRRSRRGLQTGA